MNSGGCSVLIWYGTCRTMLIDKGEPLSGDKGTRTDKHGPKILGENGTRMNEGIRVQIW